ncbi:MAG: leucine--tRNA ligase [Nitrospirae bacterium]|nr:MAG: leucine--tRNA ligase [Nitrospirota bacterium]
MAERYDPKAVEAAWQERWREAGAFRVEADHPGPKFYCLEMFPYPSGRIHMGHVRNYAIGDVIARMKRRQGYRVLHPMGWDAFGMPAENAAIERGVHPAAWTRENIAYMRRQLEKLGLSIPWEREFATCDPAYYRWEQLLFTQMVERGIAYKRFGEVNWCESCATVLANEQVEEGSCWRCGNPVVVRRLDQWFLKITDYAEELLEGLDRLEGWPERVRAMQRHWIGRSEGARIRFPVVDSEAVIEVFTTRPDTLFGVTFLSMAPEHPLLEEIVTEAQRPEVEALRERVARARAEQREGEELEKDGVFTGAYCLPPGAEEPVPIYAANFVLMEYGTGAVMAVPAHDQRDFEFARAYGLPIRPVVLPPDPERPGAGLPLDPEAMAEAYEGPGVLAGSGRFDGLPSEEAKGAITAWLAESGQGGPEVTYRLRDWGVSRQRYWGAPIPVVYCDACGMQTVPPEELPVLLPEEVALTGEGGSPLAACEPFARAACPRCGGPARRETDTFDTFVESSWYFLRYCSPDPRAHARGEAARFTPEELARGPFDRAEVDAWMPVDQYIGGIEHAVLHLLYARFFTKVLRDLGYVGVDEPFTRLLTQGMVCKETWRCREHGWLLPEEVEGGRCRHCGAEAERGRVTKMSKSKKNVVDPDALIDRYGADTARLFSLFAAPPERDLEWSEEGVEGCYRFLGRVWRLARQAAALPPAEPGEAGRELVRRLHQTIRKVTEDCERDFHFNTAIAAIMELANATQAHLGGEGADPGAVRLAVEGILQLLNPFAPHITEELWRALGHEEPLYGAPWPAYDPELAREETVELVCQVNGKVRARLQVAADADRAALEAAALGHPTIQRWLDGREPKKVIVVPGRLVNVVV